MTAAATAEHKANVDKDSKADGEAVSGTCQQRAQRQARASHGEKDLLSQLILQPDVQL
jgi:hypothetical protein